MEKESDKIWEKIKEMDERINSIEELINISPNITEIGKEYEKLMIETGISQDKLKETIYFDKGDFIILSEIEGENNIEKQINATLLILTISDICYNDNSMKTQDIRRKLEYMGISSLTNLSTNLKTIKTYLISYGRSTASGYKLTLPGKKSGIKILTDICNNKGS